MLCQWHKVLAGSKALQHSSGRNNSFFCLLSTSQILNCKLIYIFYQYESRYTYLNVVKTVTIALNRDVLHLRFVQHSYEKRKVYETLSIALQSNIQIICHNEKNIKILITDMAS
jgi:hypothetical protein